MNKKKGLTIIEALCAISIITILFSYIMQLELRNIGFKQYLELKQTNICLLEAVSNELTYNASYLELVNLNVSRRVYLDNTNMSLERIKNSNIINCFTKITPLVKPYIVILINNENILSINIKMYFKYANKEEMLECQTFKGNY